MQEVTKELLAEACLTHWAMGDLKSFFEMNDFDLTQEQEEYIDLIARVMEPKLVKLVVANLP